MDDPYQVLAGRELRGAPHQVEGLLVEAVGLTVDDHRYRPETPAALVAQNEPLSCKAEGGFIPHPIGGMDGAFVGVRRARILQRRPVAVIGNVGIRIVVSSGCERLQPVVWGGRSGRSCQALGYQGGARKCLSRYSGERLGIRLGGSGRRRIPRGCRRGEKGRYLGLERANVEGSRCGDGCGRPERLFQIAGRKDPANAKKRNHTDGNRDEKGTVERGAGLHTGTSPAAIVPYSFLWSDHFKDHRLVIPVDFSQPGILRSHFQEIPVLQVRMDILRVKPGGNDL